MAAVKIVEVGPRDGLQNIDNTLPAILKIELIRRLSRTGLQVIESTSFVSPKWVPQLADGEEVISAIDTNSVIKYPVLVPNLKGLEAAIRAGAKDVGVFVSVTEGFSQKNQNCSVAEALQRAKEVTIRAMSLGINVRAYASCIFACPYDGPTDPVQVLKVTKALLDMGCFEVSLGDTVGVGTPAQVRRLLDVLLKEVPASRLAGHFHDTFGQAVANAVAAYEMGIRVFDSSVSGLGGCPFSPGAKGNLATEDIVYTFLKMGIPTGVDIDQLVEIGDWISKQIGIENGSRAGAAIYARKHHLGKVKKPLSVSKAKKLVGWLLVDDVKEYQLWRHPQRHVLKVLLTRPKNGNALTISMLKSLTSLFTCFHSDPSISTIVIAATGRFFCTGMDLSASGATSSISAKESKDAQFNGLLDLFEAIDNAPQTTIAAIQGPCYGGGSGLAFVCDIRLAVKDANFTLSEVKLGLCPATISKYLCREWGVALAREAILTARAVTPKELHDKIGAVHGIAENIQDLEDLINRKLEDLRRCAPDASAKSKDLVRAAYQYPGGVEQAQTIKDVFDRMILPSPEARYGTEQFRAGNRDIDWDAFVDGKGVGTMKPKL
jgi:hydroxymethylglutaryl-CoA lyase